MFKEYRRKQVAELRPVTEEECKVFHDNINKKSSFPSITDLVVDEIKISISSEDRKNGSPKIGDMIARNPKNHKDQWLVAEKYFNDNFEEV